MRKKKEDSGVSYDGLERLMEALEADILSEFDPAQLTRVIRHLIYVMARLHSNAYRTPPN